ncbi:glycoside hydrolase family 88 protein [Arthrobacter rhombi]|uniref:hypothetical protein n=1 Tax=Arthrobacter rhombi TaxID=71253 RepID=UPI0031CEB48B
MIIDAQKRMLARISSTRESISGGLPHWARPETGEWVLTPDGDWTGGAYVGELWLAALADPARFTPDQAYKALSVMLPRIEKRTAFKGFGFYFGAAVGAELFDHEPARRAALSAAKSLAGMFDERLGLIPLGEDAEEAASVGQAESSIDSLQATALLFWAAENLQDETMERIASAHLRRVLEIHVRDDDSVIQSSTLDPETGRVLRTHTHKGYNDTSTWGRAQGWAMLYSAHAAMVRPQQPEWRDFAKRTIDWWIEHVPSDLVSYWDFDDPKIPAASRDTAATSMAAAACLRLAHALGAEEGKVYREFAERTVKALSSGFLTPTSEGDRRPQGILAGGCFTQRATVRSSDAGAEDVELIFGSYFLFESLAVLAGTLSPGRV